MYLLDKMINFMYLGGVNYLFTLGGSATLSSGFRKGMTAPSVLCTTVNLFSSSFYMRVKRDMAGNLNFIFQPV